MIEDFFEGVGYGRYQLIQIVLSAIAVFIEGIHLTLSATMIIPLEKYFVVNDTQFEIASAIIFLGVGLGSYLISLLTQKFGRMLSLRAAIVSVTIFQLLSVIWKSFLLFTIFRFFIGFSIGVIVPVTLNILCEYCPIKMRSYLLSSIWGFFVIGNISTLILMLIYMPDLKEDNTQSVLIGLFVISAIVAVVYFIFLEDSPRNLILTSKEQEAFKIIDGMHKANPQLVRPENSDLVDYITSGSNTQFSDKSLGSLFKKDVLWTTVILIIIWATNSMISYGPFLIFGPTLQKLKIVSDGDIIYSMMILCALSLVVLLIFPLLSETQTFGLKRLTIIMYACSFISAVFILVTPSAIYWLMIINGLFNSVAFNVSTTYSCSLYPTKIRDTALGFFYACTRAGGFASQFLFLGLFNINWIVPYYLLAVLIALALVCSILLKQEPSFEVIDKEMIHN